MTRLIALTVTLTSSAAAMAEQYSISCERQGSLHYVTFDTDSNRVIYENASETAIKGRIISSSRVETTFDLVQPGRPTYRLIWRSSAGSLTVIGLPENPARPTIVMNCSKVGLRPVLPFYERIAPTE